MTASDWARIRLQGVLALLAVLSLTACTSWQTHPQEAPGQWHNPHFPTTLAEVSETQPQRRELPIEHWTTPEGARVLFVAAEQLPMVKVRMIFNAGAARDTLPGVASLTSQLLNEGTRDMDVDALATGFENLGARFSTGSYRDMALISLTSLSQQEYLQPATALLRQLLAAPAFPESALQRTRQQYLQSLAMRRQRPDAVISDAWEPLLFDGHPYGIPPDGTEESLPGITREHLLEHYRTWYNSRNLTIAIVGDLSREQAETLATELVAPLPDGKPAAALPLAGTHEQPLRRHLDFDATQTHIYLGNQLIHNGHPDQVPLFVANHILGGGGFTSILMSALREERGLVYGVSSSISPMAAAGPFLISLQTANENAGEALALTLSLLEDFVARGPTQEQVDNAIAYITGSFALSTASNEDIVGRLGAMGFYDLRLDYLDWFQQEVARMTPEIIHQAVQRHLDPSKLAILSLGPAQPELPAED